MHQSLCKQNIYTILMIMSVILSVLLAMSIGSLDISLTDSFNCLFSEHTSSKSSDSLACTIIWEIRLPRILMAAITGAGLSAAGLILQSVTRNPLADPYLFGISSGASLGAVSAMTLFAGTGITIIFGALSGGILSILLMLIIAGRSVYVVEKLLLSGVAISFMLSAFMSLILYYSTPDVATSLLFWMMGSFENSQWNDLLLPAVYVLTGAVVFFIFRRWITVIQTGDETALALGIPVNQLRVGILLVCAIMTAVIVAHVGGIGFVGLMIPHIARYWVGTAVQRVLLTTILLGSVFMIWVDVVARSLLEAQVLPIGIVTSAIGSIFFFIMLKRRK
ncbi:MAG: iron ABC transporter permease [Gammaproteobacteria bacterium]|nr:iron ABC transporter permease [Gammaproteobacteria bacterium]MDH5630064.1 iron ABC transporter permease [Gammaproteobacteria bacterium]